MSSVVDKCVCLYCLKGTKSIIKAAVSDFFFFTFSVAVGRCLYHVCRATPCPLPTRRGSFSNTRPRQSRHGPRICSLERDNAIHTQYAHRKLNTPTHTLWPSVSLSCPLWHKWMPQGQRETSSLKKDPFCLLFWLNFKISLVLFRCFFFFLSVFLSLLDTEVVPFFLSPWVLYCKFQPLLEPLG